MDRPIYVSDILTYKAIKKARRKKKVEDFICLLIACLPFVVLMGLMFTTAYMFVDLLFNALF